MTNKKIFESFTLKDGITIKNRIVMAPMTTKSSFHDGCLLVMKSIIIA